MPNLILYIFIIVLVVRQHITKNDSVLSHVSPYRDLVKVSLFIVTHRDGTITLNKMNLFGVWDMAE